MNPPRDAATCIKEIRVLHLAGSAEVHRRVWEGLRRVEGTRFRVVSAASVAEGEGQLRRERFDVALVGLSLPDAQGPAVVERVRRWALRLPIVVLSEPSDAGGAREVLRCGAQDFLRLADASPESLRMAIEMARERLRCSRETDQRARALAVAEERVRWIINSNADGVVIVDSEGVVQFANAAASDLFGRSLSELAAQVFGFPIVSGQTTEIDVLRPDGSTRIAEMRVVESRWEDKRMLVASLRDVTERKRLEENLIRSQRMESIGSLAGGIAHDLNNVLSPILMAADMLRTRVLDGEGRHLLQTVADSAQRAADMVRQVLTFARGAEGRHARVSSEHAVRDIEGILKDTFLKSIRVITRTAAGVWPVLVDATQLHQVLLNLCVNARDAMPGGGELEISVDNTLISPTDAQTHAGAKPGPYVVFSVSDNGTGMTKDVLQRIFDPFFTTKDVGKGTGLGLATVQGIVRSHQGFLTVYSEPGRGSTFRVYLPAADGPDEEKTAGLLPDAPRGRSELVLVVDDEASVRQMVKFVLEAYGYRTLVADDGPEALSLFARHRGEIRLVLTDMMMPNLDGAAAIRAFRAIHPTLSIIATSGLANDSHTSAARRAGCTAFLPKPFTSHHLLRAVRGAVDGVG